ncbi:MAG: ABC transporter permease [Candidatus Cloacimonetes bacterium]|nr:ABC transporter permease [Candidatus Cloacimonadota bacterium]
MLRNYLKISLRNLNRYRFFSIINILGFALGLFVCFIIALYVIFDLSFDRYHSNGEQIYRVVSFDNTRNWISAVTSGPFLLRLGEEIPEIAGSTRLTFGFSRLQPGEIPDGSDSLAIFRQALFTGPGFFDVFDFKIISGNSETPLVNLQGVYLTEEAAELLFGDEDPVGRPLNTNFINDAFVAGIINGPPVNSHLQFGAIFPLNVERNPIWWDSWENLALTGYIRLREGADPEVVEQKVVELARRYGMSEVFTPRLQPLLKMHMDSQGIRYDAINQQKTSREVVYGLIVIGLLVLLVAAINFINLTSARSSKRAREIGMRKIVGAARK